MRVPFVAVLVFWSGSIPRGVMLSAAPLIESQRAVARAGDSSADSAGDSAGESDYALLRAMQDAYRAVAVGLRPYLVRIETVGGAQPRDFVLPEDDEGDAPPPAPRPQTPFRDRLGSPFVVADGPTTGIIYSADGYLVTSSFNFVRDPLLMTVTLSDGRRLPAELIARDQVRKIALLKIDAADLPVPRWSRERDIRVGQTVVALGLGFGGVAPSITRGVVSAVNRMRGNAIQTDAKLSPANYGGPICDLHGRVLGIAVPMAQRPGELAGAEMYDSGIGFAVPKHRLDEIVAVLKTGRSFYRGWLGIQVEPGVSGAVVVRNVADPSPMAQVGVQPGDMILSIEDTPIKHFGHLVQALYMIPAGEQVHLQIARGEQHFEAVVTLARSTELGALPDLQEPFDPSAPSPSE